mmetsp:Transcript_26067/g.68405  ORF Transcript_26067/g.68405 Transcript_26067/m.68405 type:complete len:533 (-) Transcript_26067:1356-2954(-)|eukprot:CAMPEP_0182950682 /NCGR_PEP_ID=MMETSP0105_2-20130417/60885_1 /TAXON_ID=81532 ORGANISM="Acanthoeca-like sp., Strain 10tr" /NCGR_SAMPLE_ID=MMETSP0105_2 /ASSEMBLY_ACC=CAM_ASM_000205 /LENGTH=532 /DNA_ID=CAMNT_0025090985 /DNA_START=117 /DNA_END=1715 /DNA_ORIENTATION=+
MKTTLQIAVLAVAAMAGDVAAQDCETNLDIVFVIDASGTVTDSQWIQAMTFVKTFTGNFAISENQTRAALVTFATNPVLNLNLDEGITQTAIDDAADAANNTNRLTYTNKALDLVRTDVLPVARTDVPCLVVVVTDGLATNNATMQIAAEALRAVSTRITVHAIGINVTQFGNSQTQLEWIAGDTGTVSNLDNFTALNSIIVQLVEAACSDAPTSSPSQAPTVSPTDSPTTSSPTASPSILVLSQTETDSPTQSPTHSPTTGCSTLTQTFTVTEFSSCATPSDQESWDHCYAGKHGPRMSGYEHDLDEFKGAYEALWEDESNLFDGTIYELHHVNKRCSAVNTTMWTVQEGDVKTREVYIVFTYKTGNPISHLLWVDAGNGILNQDFDQFEYCGCESTVQITDTGVQYDMADEYGYTPDDYTLGKKGKKGKKGSWTSADGKKGKKGKKGGCPWEYVEPKGKKGKKGSDRLTSGSLTASQSSGIAVGAVVGVAVAGAAFMVTLRRWAKGTPYKIVDVDITEPMVIDEQTNLLA